MSQVEERSFSGAKPGNRYGGWFCRYCRLPAHRLFARQHDSCGNNKWWELAPFLSFFFFIISFACLVNFLFIINNWLYNQRLNGRWIYNNASKRYTNDYQNRVLRPETIGREVPIHSIIQQITLTQKSPARLNNANRFASGSHGPRRGTTLGVLPPVLRRCSLAFSYDVKVSLTHVLFQHTNNLATWLERARKW